MNQDTKPIIMAIDDDPVILHFLSSILIDEYCVLPFKSGKRALAFPAAATADLILLDRKMPDMSGIDVLKTLQNDPFMQEIPVIILTGSEDSECEVEALELGAVDYIAKPIRSKILLSRIRVQLELRKHQKHLEMLVDERTRSMNEAFDRLRTREDVTLNMLAKATDLRDHDTGGHIERTTEFVRVILDDILQHPRPGYEVTRNEADDIIRSSKLHDVGKIAMPDHILLKHGKLSDAEFDIIKTHPVKGKEFLSDFIQSMDDSFLYTARDIAYFHHERWDGSGYPLGLREYEIPLSARIVAIADVYDALTSARPYKDALSHENAVKIILENSGTQFDPYITSILGRHADEFRRISDHIGKLETTTFGGAENSHADYEACVSLYNIT